MTSAKIYGRDKDTTLLKEYYAAKESNLIAIIGRRRIGKTYLIRTALEEKIDFEFVGLRNGSKKDQLKNFHLALKEKFKLKAPAKASTNWIDAFYELQKCLTETKNKKDKKVIFLDEFPWINTPKSGFVEIFAHFWNSWASVNNVLIIVSGSAATWMLKNIVNGKGGLHNRISQTIYLKPFQLEQTKEMLGGMGVKATIAQYAELYMIFGGVPYYLSLLKKSKSIYQNIDALLFEENGKLVNEYDNLLPSLFDNPKNHLAVLAALASKWKGLSRTELTKVYKKADGGGLTEILSDLELSGFITSYIPFRKEKKDTLYRITDGYILFYLKFLKRNVQDSFIDITKTANYRIWCGYAFENVCLQHINEIKRSLMLTTIKCNVSSFIYKGDTYNEGFQIDLLIERADNVINICEIKYYNKPFVMDRKYYQQIKNRLTHFQEIAGNKTVIHFTMITSNGVLHNEYHNELVDAEISVGQFF
jgi:uncharacterized protein